MSFASFSARRAWLGAISCGLLGWLLSALPSVVNIENQAIDLRMRLRTPDRIFAEGVRVVLIDDAAMADQPYRSPIPRDLLADLIRRVSAGEPNFIALDVVLGAATDSERDRALANAIQEAGNVVLVADRVSGGEGMEFSSPNKLFRDAHAVGHPFFEVDAIDKTVRNLDAGSVEKSGEMMSLAATLSILVQGTGRLQGDSVLINYQGMFSAEEDEVSAGAVTTLPASVVRLGVVPGDWFKGKVVLIGAGFSDSGDRHRVPLSGRGNDYSLMPGVEIHANALATLLSGQSIERVTGGAAVLIVLVFVGVMTFLESRLKTTGVFVCMPLLIGFYSLGSVWIFDAMDVALPLIPVWLAVLGGALFLAAYRSRTEGRQRRWIRNAFSHYISPEYLETLMADPAALELGGELKELTVMFTDLEGFTAASEKANPVDVVDWLNGYLQGMTDVIVKHNGTVDKFVGDAIMAFWGAPVDQDDQTVSAARCALEMQDFADAYNRSEQTRGGISVRTRIGIHTGDVFVGNIGSRDHFNYTIIGDTVNLAARIEGANKEHKTWILLSESTWSRVSVYMRGRSMGRMTIKGREQDVEVFELQGLKGESDE